MRDLVRAYYFILRRALRSRSDLRRHRTRCRHCRIFFLAHPRNRGRRDLGCPFGCRDAHRRKSSSERSAAYYRTAAGKEKKAQLNRRRRGLGGDSGADGERSVPPAAAPGTSSAARPAPSRPPAARRAELGRTAFDAGMVEHVRLVTSLIEGFAVSREQVLAMLERTVRQHRIVRERRIDYLLGWLAEHFP